MQCVGRADDLSYFKCPTTKQMRCPYKKRAPPWRQSSVGHMQPIAFSVFFQAFDFIFEFVDFMLVLLNLRLFYR
jgi:hypothetical protein